MILWWLLLHGAACGFFFGCNPSPRCLQIILSQFRGDKTIVTSWAAFADNRTDCLYVCSCIVQLANFYPTLTEV